MFHLHNYDQLLLLVSVPRLLLSQIFRLFIVNVLGGFDDDFKD